MKIERKMKGIWRRRTAAFLLAAAMMGTWMPPWQASAAGSATNANLAAGATSVVLQLNNSTLLADGKSSKVDPNSNLAPQNIGGRTMLPLRAATELMGCGLEWDGSTSAVTVHYEDRSVVFWIGKKEILVDGTTKKQIDVAPTIVNDHTMLPVRYLEEIGFLVEWEASTQSVIVTNPLPTNRLVVKSSSALTEEDYAGGNLLWQKDGYYLLGYETGRKATAAQEALKAKAKVQYVEPQHILYAASDNSYVGEISGLDKMKEQLQGQSTSSVTVALLDSGVDSSHSYLSGKIASGQKDIVNNDSQAEDETGHGTKMAGVLAEQLPSNGKILPIKVLNAQGRGTDIDIAEGMEYALSQGADVIVLGCNGSVPGCEPSQPLADAVSKALAAGVPVVAPAGNERLNTSFSVLSQIDGVVTTAATNNRNELYGQNNFGEELTVAAPGVSIKTTAKNNKYNTVTGSSYSAAVVGAALAIYKQDQGELEPYQWEAFLAANSSDKGTGGKDNYYGYGVLNVAEYQTVNRQNVQYYTVPNDYITVPVGGTKEMMVREYHTDGTYEDLTYTQAVRRGVAISLEEQNHVSLSVTGTLTGKSLGAAEVIIRYKQQGSPITTHIAIGVQVVSK